MASKKEIYDKVPYVTYMLGIFGKKLKNSNGEELVLPQGYEIERKGGKTFYILYNGEIITPKLSFLSERNLQKKIYIGHTHDGSQVRIDIDHHTVSDRYVAILKENVEASKMMVIRAEDDKVGMISNENKFLSSGYVALNYDEQKKSFSVKKQNHDNKKWYYGIMSSFGELICPDIFESEVRKFERCEEINKNMFMATSDQNEAIISDGKALLFGSRINILMKNSQFIMARIKAENEKLMNKVSLVSVFDKKSNTSSLYGYSLDKFEENCKLVGNVIIARVTKKNNVLYVSRNGDDKYLCDWEGKFYLPFDKIDNELDNGNGLRGYYIPQEDKDFLKISKDGKVGIVDAQDEKIILPVKYEDLVSFAKKEDGTYAFVVGTEHGNYGVVDASGKSIVPLKHTFTTSQKIKFDGKDRVVVLLHQETKRSAKYIYVDAANADGLATGLEINRFNGVPSAEPGKYYQKKKQENQAENEDEEEFSR